jgi:hypothetical protein
MQVRNIRSGQLDQEAGDLLAGRIDELATLFS